MNDCIIGVYRSFLVQTKYQRDILFLYKIDLYFFFQKELVIIIRIKFTNLGVKEFITNNTHYLSNSFKLLDVEFKYSQ